MYVDLTDDQVNLFWQKGFLRLECITNDQEIKWLREIYDRLILQKTKSTSEQLTQLAKQRQLPFDNGKTLLVWIPFPERIVPELKNTIYFQNSLKIAARLLNVEENKVIGEGRMFFKPAHFGTQMPWHQDAAHPNSYDILKIWMPLDPVTVENGCLQFIPGSHLGGLRPHRSYEGDPSGLSLATDHVDSSQAIVCPLPTGGATIHHRYTLHHSQANTTDIPRRAFVTVCTIANRNY